MRTCVIQDSAEYEVEVGRVVSAAFGDLPASGDGVAIVAEGRGAALGERLALPPELPLAVVDTHLVDPADAALVGVQLEVPAIGRIASDDRDVVRRIGMLGRSTLDQVSPRVMPLESDLAAPRPSLT